MTNTSYLERNLAELYWPQSSRTGPWNTQTYCLVSILQTKPLLKQMSASLFRHRKWWSSYNVNITWLVDLHYQQNSMKTWFFHVNPPEWLINVMVIQLCFVHNYKQNKSELQCHDKKLLQHTDYLNQFFKAMLLQLHPRMDDPPSKLQASQAAQLQVIGK